MQIRIDVQPDRKKLTAALRRAQRRILLLIKICGLVLGLAGLMYLLFGDTVKAAIHLAGGVLLFWPVPALIVRYSVRLSWRLYGIPTTWEFTEEGVRSRNELTDGTIRWNALSEVERMPGQLIFKINRYQVFPVPTGDLPPEQERELHAFLRGRGLLKPDRPDELADAMRPGQRR